MQRNGAGQRKPSAAMVAALVLSFAVVCPLMAAPGVPQDQGCHGGSEPGSSETGTTVLCCSSTTAPKLFTPGPGPVAALPFSGEAGPGLPPRSGPFAVRSHPLREPRPLLFLLQSSLLI